MKPVVVLESLKFTLTVLVGISYASQAGSSARHQSEYCNSIKRGILSVYTPNPLTQDTADRVAKECPLAILKLVRHKFGLLPSSQALTDILEKDPNEKYIVPYAVKKGASLDPDAHERAIKNGNLEVVRAAFWSERVDPPTTTTSMDEAVRGGDCKMFNFTNAVYKYCPNQELLDDVTRRGDLEMASAILARCDGTPGPEAVDEMWVSGLHRPLMQQSNSNHAFCPSPEVLGVLVGRDDLNALYYCHENCGFMSPLGALMKHRDMSPWEQSA